MPINLVRNSKVFFTTNLDSVTNKVLTTGFTTGNTQEIQVLDGFTFSQNTNQDTVTLSEAGTAPTRGQRSFNSSLAPVDFSFSNYIRPKNATTAITAEESVLWNALFSDQAISTTGTSVGTPGAITYTFSAGVGTLSIAGGTLAGVAVGDVVVIGGITAATPTSAVALLNAAAVVTSITAPVTLTLVNPPTGTVTAVTGTTPKVYKAAWAPVSSTVSYVSSGPSDKNQLQKFGMIFLVDQVAYAVDNCALNQVSIDFGLDSIATAAWSGQGTTLRQLATGATAVGGTYGNGLTGAYTAKVTDAQYITNKLSTAVVTLVNGLKNAAATSFGTAGDAFTVPITGGSITINNNITYITPANLGAVNAPVTYYTGTRAITGTLNAYLRTGGTKDTGELLSDLLNSSDATIEPMFAMSIALGGSANATRVTLDLPATVVSIPTIDVQQVVSTAINFTAQGFVPSATADANVYDLAKTSDISVRYYAA